MPYTRCTILTVPDNQMISSQAAHTQCMMFHTILSLVWAEVLAMETNRNRANYCPRFHRKKRTMSNELYWGLTRLCEAARTPDQASPFVQIRKCSANAYEYTLVRIWRWTWMGMFMYRSNNERKTLTRGQKRHWGQQTKMRKQKWRLLWRKRLLNRSVSWKNHHSFGWSQNCWAVGTQ